jgi:predicted RNA-binding Zn-ribbon protein involved in translation (DUF1610 family)
MKKITTERIIDAVERQQFGLDNPGFCIKCGEEQEGCEPDATKYECENCGENSVYGAEILLMKVA